MLLKSGFTLIAYNAYRIVIIRCKGKISILKKTFPKEVDDVSNILEFKNSSACLKRLNSENKYLYGDLLLRASKKFEGRYKSRTLRGSYRPDSTVLDPKLTIPIEDVIFEYESIKSVRNIVEEITNFPMSNILNLQNVDKNRDLIYKLNCLRQHLTAVNGSLKFPSVSTILEKTASPETTLEKQNSLNSLEMENKDEYQQGLFASTSLHNNISMYLTGTPESHLITEHVNSGYWKSLKRFFPSFKVRFLEEYLVHPFLCYSSLLHCCGKFRNNLVVVEWKKFTRPTMPKLSTMDSPLVIAAHVGALNFDPKWYCKPDGGLIVVAYANGNPCGIHYMDETCLLKYWKLWLKRLKSYWMNVENVNSSTNVVHNVRINK